MARPIRPHTTPRVPDLNLPALKDRFEASKPVAPAPDALAADSKKTYANQLASFILKQHQVDIRLKGDTDDLALPYTAQERTAARKMMESLSDAGPAALKIVPTPLEPPAVRPVLRRKDLMELFDTTPDLAGHDLDISRYIRDGDDTDVQVWLEAILRAAAARGYAQVPLDERLVATLHRDLCGHLISAGCERIGLPRPHTVIPTPVSAHPGAPPAHAFPRLRRNDGSERRHTHAILVFDELVRGPILIGAGRYRGYGMCRPMEVDP